MSEGSLTRAQFVDQADWLRYCHEGGLDVWSDEDGGAYAPPSGTDEWSERVRALFGHTTAAYERAWIGYPVSTHLQGPDFLAGYAALALANCRGRWLDLHASITWSLAGVTDDEAVVSHLRSFLHWVEAWCAKEGFWPSYLWVMERGHHRGLHTHLLLGVPAAKRAACRAMLPWAFAHILKLTKPLVTGDGEAVHVTGPKVGSLVSQWRMLRYLFKGLDPNSGYERDDGSRVYFVSVAGVDPQAQGVITVERFGISDTLSLLSVKWWRKRFKNTSFLLPEFSAFKITDGIYNDRFHLFYEKLRPFMPLYEAEFALHLATQHPLEHASVARAAAALS